ncbi:hypothetical protein JCGZ_16594 [Jatropha curcas]|uniref:RNA helicase n=1 Tax=Jatropha curcas TaxID=180498 RepID=A0A067KAE4_JATCU|nr:DEAD-box ATP-dependent RNA helicase 38 [Jatropha curcas]KDP29205.1 hypothetical protein JCGZ_16594 [Jatropha curcas]
MADTSETPATTTERQSKPQAAEIIKWGDVEDEEETASTSEDKVASQLEDKLTIDDSEKVDKFLEEPQDSNIQAVTAGDTPYTSATTFEDLNLTPELLKGLYVEMKFKKPSKIQAISLPMILTPPYKDLIAQAHNGSGKTTCFVLGMLSRIDPNARRPQALCICPTRELSIQNLEVLRKMGKYTGITSECAVPMDSANDRPRSRPPIFAQVVIGTPGTIKRLMSQKKLSVTDMRVLVFDEADHMLAKDGFQDDSLRIMKDIERVNNHCQILLFSATFDETVKNFVSRIVRKDYNQLFVKKEELSLDAIKQYKVYCPDELAKILVIKDRILEVGEKLGQTIIFVSSKRSAGMLHKALVELGYEVTTIHGALTHEDRDKIVKEFKDGLTQVLISTDLLARGFDQQQVNLVINYDLPVKFESPNEPNYEVYLHRIGRAGRFGRKGAVFNFVMDDRDRMIMEKIETYFGTQVAEVPSWDSEEDFKVALKAAGLL